MASRGDILVLGLTAGVTGSLVGGMMLGVGMDLIAGGQPLGWLLLLPGGSGVGADRLSAGTAAGGSELARGAAAAG